MRQCLGWLQRIKPESKPVQGTGLPRISHPVLMRQTERGDTSMFTKGFNKYACDGDSITCTVEGFDCTATIYHDDCGDRPDERDDGFWPSLDPKSAGYIGEKSKSTLARQTAKAKEVMAAWERDEWWYVGVAVTVSKNDIQLTGRFDHACWGVDCNYPGSDNSYLMDIANEELGSALAAAREAIAGLVEVEP
jgi:hypothetical protein